MPPFVISSLRGGRTREDLAWAAGLFEGEGSFTFAKRNGKYVSVVAQIGMTDEDRVRQFCSVVGVGNVTTHPKPLKPHWKTVHVWKTASFEGTQAVIALLWHWLGPRRRAKAKEVLALYRQGQRVVRHRPETVAEVKRLLADGVSKRQIATRLAVSYGFVNHIKQGRIHARVA